METFLKLLLLLELPLIFLIFRCVKLVWYGTYSVAKSRLDLVYMNRVRHWRHWPIF